MRLVILESPYAANNFIGRWLNRRYARRCVRDSLMRGEAPLASHLLYTQPGILRDDNPEDRLKGIGAGLAWCIQSEATVVYVDRGISRGMQTGIDHAKRKNRPIEFREIY